MAEELQTRKICVVIGAGASGLTAIKCCLDEGIEPICFEKNNHIGGLWFYKEDMSEDACTYKSTIINTSKEMMAFSDFPPPHTFANYMHNTKIIEYFNLYCTKFGLRKYINFNTAVLSCKPTSDFDETGKWVVKTENSETGKVSEVVCDGLLVGVGHHAQPNFPKESFKGLTNFQGIVMHSHDYRVPAKFEGKRVLVVGIGNSGGDIAVETSRVAKQVILSTRRGSWVMNRVSEGGMPIDIVFSRRSTNFINSYLPVSIADWIGARYLCGRFDHTEYGLKPKHGVTSQHPMVNDDLPNRILAGLVRVRGDVREFREWSVMLDNGAEEEIDVVIFSTGYNFKFPFIDESIIKVTGNRTRLYKNMWPANLSRNTLAIIGLIQPTGAINPISEIQCRWATRVIKGVQKLPSSDVMNEDIDRKAAEMRERYYESVRHTIQVDYVQYMDEISELIVNEKGVRAKPELWRLIKEDPKLGLTVIFGPATPYHYRLNGPGTWPDARQTILTQKDRIASPLRTRRVDAGTSATIYILAPLIVLFLTWFISSWF